jgi:diacylglycerol cholinephosphotransferase
VRLPHDCVQCLYVCSCVCRIDIAEAHYAQISVLCLSGLLGTHFWTNLFPGLALELKVVLVYGTLVFTVLNLLHAFYIILTCGVGKNGSTVADTSVLSPIISPIVVTTTLVYHALYSPSQLVHTHYILFFTAFGIQVTKITLLMMMAGMTRTPYPLLDPIMVGPVLLCLNMHFPLIPDLLLMSLVAVYAVFDVSQTCVMSIHQICCFLDVPCFSVPLSQSTDQQETPEKTSQTPGSHKE